MGSEQTFYCLWDQIDTWNQVKGPIDHLSLYILLEKGKKYIKIEAIKSNSVDPSESTPIE